MPYCSIRMVGHFLLLVTMPLFITYSLKRFFQLIRRRASYCACLVIFLPAYVSGEPVLSVDAILGNVVNANRSYSYKGLLTYEAEGSLSTLSLYQFVDGTYDANRVYQQLEFLDGENRRVIRDQALADCVGGDRWGLRPSVFNSENLKHFYHMKLLGTERVAGRQTHTIELTPKDHFRHGYRFNIDVQTNLLLRSIIVSEKKSMLERTQFVDLQLLNTSLADDDGNDDAISWRVPEVAPCHAEQFQSAWSVGWIPEGFISAGNRVTAQGEQVLMFTDGLVSISVFITSVKYENLPKMTAHRGATVAVMSALSIDGVEKTVVVVGEVPTITARQMAISVQPQ